MRAAVLIPAKGFTKSKQRLAPLLSGRGRWILAQAMLHSVLDQVLSARGVEATFVVTANAEVMQLAESLGAQVIQEQQERGETEAVALALRNLRLRGLQTVLILPGDLPLIRSSDVESVLNQVPVGKSASPFAVLVPSRDHMGTNALLLSPPDVIRPRFGYDSFCGHLSEVSNHGIAFKVLENERIALDIDSPRDLEHFRCSAYSAKTPGRQIRSVG